MITPPGLSQSQLPILLASPNSLMAHWFMHVFISVVLGFATVHTMNKEKFDDSIAGRAQHVRELEHFHEGVIFRLTQEVGGQRG